SRSGRGLPRNWGTRRPAACIDSPRSNLRLPLGEGSSSREGPSSVPNDVDPPRPLHVLRVPCGYAARSNQLKDYQMYGPTSHLYFSQRLRLHYVDWGNEGAPNLLLIHGGRDHCRNWDWVAERLRDRFHIVAPDLRGHGDSDWTTGSSYNEINYIYDVAQLVHQ